MCVCVFVFVCLCVCINKKKKKILKIPPKVGWVSVRIRNVLV